ncbi:MAG: CRISPR-associated endonuclease Cas6 [Bernardetiaceae bacterium]
MKTIHITTLRFPGLCLNRADAHRLRGYFSHLFRERSPLLHNHLEGGGLRYQYPLVQYKVVHGGIPVLVGLQEGAELLLELFTKVDHLQLGDRYYPTKDKQIEFRTDDFGCTHQLHRYRFDSLWMALNQNNYERYRQASPEEQKQMLNKILIGNILTFFKGIDLRIQVQLLVDFQMRGEQSKETQFKNQRMIAFNGYFTTNAYLPPYIGLGKSTARGFGTIRPA